MEVMLEFLLRKPPMFIYYILEIWAAEKKRIFLKPTREKRKQIEINDEIKNYAVIGRMDDPDIASDVVNFFDFLVSTKCLSSAMSGRAKIKRYFTHIKVVFCTSKSNLLFSRVCCLIR